MYFFFPSTSWSFELILTLGFTFSLVYYLVHVAQVLLFQHKKEVLEQSFVESWVRNLVMMKLMFMWKSWKWIDYWSREYSIETVVCRSNLPLYLYQIITPSLSVYTVEALSCHLLRLTFRRNGTRSQQSWICLHFCIVWAFKEVWK